MRSSSFDSILNPRDGLFVDEVRSAVKSVRRRQDKNMLAGFDAGAMIKEIIDSSRDPMTHSR